MYTNCQTRFQIHWHDEYYWIVPFKIGHLSCKVTFSLQRGSTFQRETTVWKWCKRYKRATTPFKMFWPTCISKHYYILNQISIIIGKLANCHMEIHIYVMQYDQTFIKAVIVLCDLLSSYQSQFLHMWVTNWPYIFVDQGQFSDADFISGTHQR
jgi:hypothetical protein